MFEQRNERRLGTHREPVVRRRAVEVRHGAGTFVTDIEFEYLCEVYQLRMELVTCMYRLRPKPVPDDLLDRMRDTQQRCVNIPESISAKRHFASLNIEFFEQLMELAGNRPLREMLTLLFYRAARMWPFLMNEELVRREAETFHNEIGEVTCLVEAGEVGCVGQLRRKHIGMALERLLDMSRDEDCAVDAVTLPHV